MKRRPRPASRQSSIQHERTFSCLDTRKKIYVTLSADHTELYQGPWNDLPLAEELIIAKSIEFFDDANPCFIHRDAVRVRLLAELEEAIPALQGDMPPEWLSLLSEYMGIEITHAAFYYK